MMCELIESFTVVLPLCNPDIQRDCEFVVSCRYGVVMVTSHVIMVSSRVVYNEKLLKINVQIIYS